MRLMLQGAPAEAGKKGSSGFLSSDCALLRRWRRPAKARCAAVRCHGAAAHLHLVPANALLRHEKLLAMVTRNFVTVQLHQ